MRRNYLYATSLVLLTISLGLLAFVFGHQRTPKPSSSAAYRLSGPYIHKNLTVFLVHGSDSVTGHNFLTLQEALAQKKVVVFETKTVNELAIQNLSAQDVYVQAGDIVRGGDQDRMISVDFIVPPKSGRMPIAAFCVESQRWSRRGNEEARNFSSSENSASTKSLKLAAKRANSQQEVWANVADTQVKLSNNVGRSVQAVESRSSLELSVENDKVKETTASYINALSGILANKTDVIGYAFAINGRVNSADVYASGQLFAKLWPKLLKANAVEAVAELQKDVKAEPVTDGMIEEFLVASERGKVAEKEVTQRVRLLMREDDQNIFFETRDRSKQDAWIHRNYIRK
jgi:hypothetical protein